MKKYILFFFLIYGVAYGAKVPDEQISVQTNEIGNQSMIFGETVEEVFSNLPSRVNAAISNVASTIASNLDVTLSNAINTTFYPRSNPSNYITGAGASNNFLNVTNDFYLNSNPSNFITESEFNDLLPDQNNGFLRGVEVTYNSGSAVTIGVGEGVCSSSNFVMTVPTAHALTSVIGAGYDFIYIYIDHSASSYPSNGLVYIDALTEPTFSNTKFGWYNGQDRCIGAVFTTTGMSTIVQFDMSDDVYTLLPANTGQVVRLLNDATATGTGLWEIPNIVESDVTTPVFATRITLYVQSDQSHPGATTAASTIKEIADLQPGNLFTNGFTMGGEVPSSALIAYHSHSEVAGIGTMALGASRKVRYYAGQDDDSASAMYQIGWEISR